MLQLPQDFIKRSRQLMGDALYARLEEGLAQESPVSVHLNPFKATAPKLASTLRQVPWCEEGYYLSERPKFTFDPLLHAGLYYVQEASSMFLYQAVRQLVDQPVHMLDLCAAPGGKSLIARSALPEGSLLFCNEPVRLRAQILSENVIKFGHPDVVVTQNTAADYARSGLQFDIILTDVPCSGEGMFRKDDDAISHWSVRHVEDCQRLQREIVNDIWPCLKAGGLLVYSTCTFNREEDEDNANWICQQLGAEYVRMQVQDAWNITGSLTDGSPVYRFLPGVSEGEGLFMTVLRKKDGAAPNKIKDKDAKRKNIQPTAPVNWLKQPEAYDIESDGKVMRAIPKAWNAVYRQARRQHLNILHAGVTLGELKGKDLVPSESLALSTALNREAFPTCEVSYRQAIDFLSKQPVTLPDDTPRGYVLLTFRNIPLGFEKNIGNRANNLYPQEWRIKSTYMPENYNTPLYI